MQELRQSFFITLFLGSVRYPNHFIWRVNCIGHIGHTGKEVSDAHIVSNSELFYIQNCVVMNRVMKRLRCIKKVYIIFESCHEKTCLCHMRTTKAQISLLICEV